MSFFYRVARSVSRAAGPDCLSTRAFRPQAERMLRLATRRRGLTWEINGVSCRIDPQFRAQLARNYDAHIAALLRDKVRPGQTCLDVGANIGAWVIQFAHLVGPSGRVVAFEPNPGARAVLEDHVRLNHLEQAMVVPTAVGAEAGEVTFFAAGSDGMSRIGEPNPHLSKPSRPISTPVVTLDEWCAANGVAPDWILIDTEGFEGHVLAGATHTIRKRGRALGIIVEMHPSLWPASGTTRDEVSSRIAALGRRALPLNGQTDPFARYGHVWLEPYAGTE